METVTTANTTTSITEENDNFDIKTQMISGATAGAVADTLFHPFETIKTRLQTQPVGNVKYNGVAHTVITIRREEGIRGLYKGLTSTILGTCPDSATYFTVYEGTKRILLPFASERQAEGGAYLAAGAIGDISASAICVPFEVVGLRMQMSRGFGENSYAYRNVIHGLYSVYRRDGISSLYRGMGATMMRDVPFSALQFMIYEFMKQFLEKHKYFQSNSSSVSIAVDREKACTDKKTGNLENPNNKDSKEDPMAVAMFSGATAGGLAALGTNPMDVAKTRLQTQKERIYRNSFHAMQQIWLKEGISGLFKGSLPRIALTASVVSVTFTCLEEAKVIFGRLFQQNSSSNNNQ